MINNTWKEDHRVLRFIDLLMNQLHTEQEAVAIRDEMFDHLECLIEDYSSRNYTMDKAIVTALKQMGDPTMIGYAFTNPAVMKKRNFYLWLFKGLGLCFAALAIITGVIGTYNTTDAISDYGFILFYVFYIALLLNSRYRGTKLKYLEVDATPLMIVWPVKNKISKANLAISSFVFLVFSPLFFVVLFIVYGLIYESSGLFLALMCFFVTLLAIIALVISEKFRLPKHILCAEGLITKGRFTPWIAIHKTRIKNDYLGETNNKIIELLDGTNLQAHPKLKIHPQQLNLVKSIINDKL